MGAMWSTGLSLRHPPFVELPEKAATPFTLSAMGPKGKSLRKNWPRVRFCDTGEPDCGFSFPSCFLTL